MLAGADVEFDDDSGTEIPQMIRTGDSANVIGNVEDVIEIGSVNVLIGGQECSMGVPVLKKGLSDIARSAF